MKILHVVPSFGLGGMEKIACAIMNATLDLYDHEVVSITNNQDAALWLKRPCVTLTGIESADTRCSFFRKLGRVIQERKPDVLMTYNWGATDAIWLGRLLGCKHIIHSEHGFNIDEATALSRKRDIVRFVVYRMASKVVVVSTDLARMMRKKFHLHEKKLAFIPNGIDTSSYVQSFAARERLRAELGLKKTDFVIGFSGRLDPVKNFDLMIRIVSHCVSEDPNCKLLIIGDGPERKKIESLSQALNLQKHVILVGQKNEVLDYVRCFDAFLLTSHREQMPMTILEAMSIGVPVVAPHVGEIPHVIEHGLDGFLVHSQASPEVWAAVLRSLKEHETHQHVGILARQKVVKKFQECTMLNSYKHLLESVIYR